MKARGRRAQGCRDEHTGAPAGTSGLESTLKTTPSHLSCSFLSSLVFMVEQRPLNPLHQLPRNLTVLRRSSLKSWTIAPMLPCRALGVKLSDPDVYLTQFGITPRHASRNCQKPDEPLCRTLRTQDNPRLTSRFSVLRVLLP